MNRAPFFAALVLAAASLLFHATPVTASPGTGSYPNTTTSIYEHGTSTSTLYNQGCSAGSAASSGVVILDFGRPAEKSNNYGTIDFSGNFDTDSDILTAMEQFAQGYHDCLPGGSSAKVSIARGTNNSCSNEDLVCCPRGCGLQP